MPDHQFPNLLRAVLAMPWAIDPDSLAWAAICDVLALRAAGQSLSDAEIQARIEAAQNGPRGGGGRARGVAVIPVYGVISQRQNLLAKSSGGTSAEAVAQALRGAMADPDVDGIVLDVDSPGGVVEGMDELASEIRAAREQKPIVAVANHMAASAAYWLASAANEIVATPSAMVGAVGVFTAHDDITEAQAKLGIKRTVIAAGKHKAEGALGQPLSDDAKAHVQAQVDEFYSMMVHSIAKGRGVGVDAVRDTYGEGRSVLSKAALAAGMIDRIDSLDNTIKRVARGAVAGHAKPAVLTAYHADNPHDAIAALVSGLPLSERLALVSAQAKELEVHALEHADMRAKEGRGLSEATRSGLVELALSLQMIAGNASDATDDEEDDDEPEVPEPIVGRRDLEIFEAATRGGYQLPN